MLKRISQVFAAVVVTVMLLPLSAYAGDAVGAPGPLTLDDCVNIALGGHPKVLSAEQDREAGLYVTRQAMASYWPQLSLGANRNYSKSERLIRFGSQKVTTTSEYVSNSFDFTANWLLFDFGRRYFNVRSLSKLEDKLMHDMDAAQQTVAFDVMEAYFGVLKAQELIKVAQATKDAAELHLQRARTFYDAGSKPRFDVTQAEVEVNEAELGLITARDALKLAAADLNTKLGREPLSTVQVEPLSGPVKLDRELKGYLDDAYANRPELASLASSIESSEMGVYAAMSDFLPRISASASQNWYLEDEMDKPLESQSLNISLDVPLFEGLASYNRYNEAKARLIATGYRLDDLRRDITLEVSKAYLDFEDARARAETLESSIKKARENLEIAEGRYEAGVGPIIEVTDARVALTEADTNLAQARFDYHLAYTRLLKSTGKVLGGSKEN